MSNISLSEIAICRRYIQSKFKSKIVETLAQGNNCSKDEIIDILKKHGLSYPPMPGKKTDAEMKAIEVINNDPDPMFKPAVFLTDIDIPNNDNNVERKSKATIKKQIKKPSWEEYVAKTEITMCDEKLETIQEQGKNKKTMINDSKVVNEVPESVKNIVRARALQLEKEIKDYKERIKPLETELAEINYFLKYGGVVK